MKKRGISLIVLIITIIVVIILAAVVILTILKNNPIESAKEARFKEDVRGMQSELSLYLTKEYQKNLGEFDKTSVNLAGNDMVNLIPSTKKYIASVKVQKGDLVYIGDVENEEKWCLDLGVKVLFPSSWKKYIADITDDGVPIPHGFTYKEGSKETGTVIEDEKHNEFVWIPASESTYKRDYSFKTNYTVEGGTISDDSLPTEVDDEISDVKKYGGFYIGRYEATIPEPYSGTYDVEDVPTCQKGKHVWYAISYSNAKKSAEKMYSSENSSVLSGLLTGSAWDTTCHWISDAKITLSDNTIENISLTDSRKYGNYTDSQDPAKVKQYQNIETAGYSDKWCVKNIYDLAGNIHEWTYEKSNYRHVIRGGSCEGGTSGADYPVIYGYHRYGTISANVFIGFRVRLYIKTK